MSVAAAIPYHFDANTHTYSTESGLIVPSVTQILSSVGLYDLDRIPFDVLERKRILGTKVHKASEFIDTPNLGELDWDSLDEEAVPYVVGYESFCRDFGFKATLIEKSGIHQTEHGMMFGYTIDRVGTMDDRVEALIDIKCAYDEEVSWKFQLAAYELTLPPRKGGYMKVAVKLQPDGTYKTYDYNKPIYRDGFLWALALTWMKINEGIKLELQ